MKRTIWPVQVLLLVWSLAARSAEPELTGTAPRPLIVVEDLGGVSALPYYRALNLQTPPRNRTEPNVVPPVPKTPGTRFSESDMLPVRSEKLTPGDVEPRVIRAPGLSPFFLVGDDPRSRAWLRARIDSLRELRAVGFVVNVNSADALSSLRQLAPGLTLAPASGDDLAERLGLHHYPALITATGIE
jgi:integrating conjugative element protein (TIGR03765 family)